MTTNSYDLFTDQGHMVGALLDRLRKKGRTHPAFEMPFDQLPEPYKTTYQNFLDTVLELLKQSSPTNTNDTQ